MEEAVDKIVIKLSREEAVELFMRCLRSQEEDNEHSVAVLRKLATKLESGAEPQLRAA